MNRLSLFATANAIILGALPILFLPELPRLTGLFTLIFIGVLCLFLPKELFRWLAIFLLSASWAITSAMLALSPLKHVSDETQWVEATITQMLFDDQQPYLIFAKINKMGEHDLPFYQQFRVGLLKMPDDLRIKAGQRWRLQVAFRPVHSQLNEGGFDSQRYAVSHHQVLHAFVKNAELIRPSIHWRQQLIDRIDQKIHDYDYRDIIIALAFGERALLSTENTALLKTTGTIHLMAISGLHIALASFFGFLLAKGVQFFFPIRLITPNFPFIVGFLIALFYTLLSGANPPAIRAIVALACFLFLRLKRQRCRTWTSWFIIVAILIVLDPLMLLTESFWLSCCAVAIILFYLQWFPLPARFAYSRFHFLLSIAHLQIGFLLLLAPLQWLFFHGISISSLFANIVAIPAISFISLPLILASLVLLPFSSLCQALLSLANLSLNAIFYCLNFFNWGWISLSDAFVVVIFCGWIGVFLWRFNAFKKGILVTFLFVSATVFEMHVLQSKTWKLEMLDVGHGLAMVIHRNKKAILYDVGNAYENSSFAERVILPFLRTKGLQVEGIIISHDDQDHRGGLDVMRTYFPKAWVRSPSTLTGDLPCTVDQHWRWQELDFRVLWPLKRVEKAANHDSCVVQISTGDVTILLTGDLEAKQEAELVATYRNQLRSSILQVPHHGSKSSSSMLFLRTVSPQFAISSNSRFNQWRLPAEKVKQRYDKQAISWLTTARWGQITFTFSGDTLTPILRRKTSAKWYHNWFGDLPARFDSDHF